MTIRKCLAKIIPVLLFSALAFFVYGEAAGQVSSKRKTKAKAPSKTAPAKTSAKKQTAKGPSAAPAYRGGELARLVRTYRGNPSPARLAAVERYSTAHPSGESGNLARLALGVLRFESGDYAASVASLKQAGVPKIADYVAYYLGSARVEAGDAEGVGQDLAPVFAGPVSSPVAGRARLIEARALMAADPAAAIRLLREHYRDLPQPEGDLILADSYQAEKSLPAAAEFYQRVYYSYTSGAAATRAGAALAVLKDTMGADYPPPLPQQLLQRADRLLDARDYPLARAEYESVISKTAGLHRELARVRAGAVSYLSGRVSEGCAYLRALDVSAPEADAERLYRIAECSRRLSLDEEMMSAVKTLGQRYPKSTWRLRAIISAASRYLLLNQPGDYLPLYEAASQDFPGEAAAGTAHWKVAFHAWMLESGLTPAAPNYGKAGDLLRDYLRGYPQGPNAGAALYFLGRSAEQDNDPGAARAYYGKVADALPNTYYAMQARGRLQAPEIAQVAPPASVTQFLDSLKLRKPLPVPARPTAATASRIERSRLLRAAGLNDLADAELRFGSRTDGQPALLGMEMARSADAAHQALRFMKSSAGDYLSMSFEDAPREFWELLFPLPYRSNLEAAAKANDLDPFLLAGLIRQESEFNPEAISRARAYGLTQVLPGTGRQYARRAGIPRFSSRLLLQPAANLKIGSTVLRSMLDSNGGKLEPTLASYNAGPNRAADWLTWNNFREPAEFVETIPFTETRDYVQAVLRNADIYRRLYTGK